MNPLSATDKTGLASTIETAIASYATAQATLPMIDDEELRKLVETQLRTRAAQLKKLDQFVAAH